MADKEINIKVTTDTDTSQLEDLNNILDTTTGKADEVGEALRTALSDAEDEVEELAETLAQIEMGEIDGDYEEVAEQLSEATDQADALATALNDINADSLETATSDAEGLAEGLSGARDEADGLSDSMGLIESTMLMDMANQIGAIGQQAEGMSQELDTASISVGHLATNSGIAEPTMRNLIAHISNVTFPQNEAMAYVGLLNQMGVSADKLGDSATNMDRINDATGMGFNKVMLLTQGLQSMGITADNLPASFNAIAYAEANVGGGAETLQMVLRRQAGTLNEYGMGVDATVLALSTLQRETGLTGMKLGSEFGKRLKDCNGDLSQLEQSLGLNAGALRNASNETGKYEGKLQQLADEEMEHKTITERLGAVWEDFALQMDWLISPLGSVIGLLGSFGQVALSINSIITLAQTFGILTGATETATIAQLELNLAFLSNPITWIVIAIIALIVVLGYLYFNNEQVRQAIDNLGASLVRIGQFIYSTVVGAFQWLMNTFNEFTTQLGLNTDDWGQAILGFILFLPMLPLKVGEALVNTLANMLGFKGNFVQTVIDMATSSINAVVSAFSNFWNYLVNLGANITAQVGITGNNIINGIAGFLAWWFTLPAQIAITFVNIIAKTLGFGNDFVNRISNAGRNAVSQFTSAISNLGSGLLNELNNMLGYVAEWASSLPQKFWEAGVNAVQQFLSALGINSPGTMQRMLIWEVTEMGRRVPEESKTTLKSISDFGTNIVDSFGNPTLTTDFEFSNNNLNTNGLNGEGFGQVNYFTFNEPVIDNEERMEQIMEYIRKRINWNNQTAGRTI